MGSNFEFPDEEVVVVQKKGGSEALVKIIKCVYETCVGVLCDEEAMFIFVVVTGLKESDTKI